MRLVVALLALAVLLTAAPAGAAEPIEDYASYQPAGAKCHPKPRAGTAFLSRWVIKRYGGGSAGAARACQGTPTSEHQVGRAFDWALDATKKADRRRAQQLLDRIFATDRHGNTDAWARRMGVMYVIWNDHMYPAWREFEPEPYLSSSCKSKRKCSKTLRHRDHVHVSLTLRGARGRTSWYDGRL
jgi:hypothetical protein